MGVPHWLVMSNAANFATAQADRLNFYEMTVIPESRLITDVINQQLLKPLGYNLQFKPQEMSVFQENETERSQSLVDLRNAGLPLETALVILGYEIPEELSIVEDVPEPEPAPVATDAMVDDEKSRFRRWAKKRTNPDPDDFDSTVISYADKAAILYELQDTKIIFDGIPPIPADRAITEDEIEEAIRNWDKMMPEYAGLLDADVVD